MASGRSRLRPTVVAVEPGAIDSRGRAMLQRRPTTRPNRWITFEAAGAWRTTCIGALTSALLTTIDESERPRSRELRPAQPNRLEPAQSSITRNVDAIAMRQGWDGTWRGAGLRTVCHASPHQACCLIPRAHPIPRAAGRSPAQQQLFPAASQTRQAAQNDKAQRCRLGDPVDGIQIVSEIHEVRADSRQA